MFFAFIFFSFHCYFSRLSFMDCYFGFLIAHCFFHTVRAYIYFLHFIFVFVFLFSFIPSPLHRVLLRLFLLSAILLYCLRCRRLDVAHPYTAHLSAARVKFHCRVLVHIYVRASLGICRTITMYKHMHIEYIECDDDRLEMKKIKLLASISGGCAHFQLETTLSPSVHIVDLSIYAAQYGYTLHSLIITHPKSK